MPDLPAALEGAGLARQAPDQASRVLADPAAILKAILFAALGLPVIVAAWFVGSFSTAMPLTDEWFFLRSVIALDETPLSDIGRIVQSMPYRIYDHHVILPFLLYWPIGELSNFDNRAIIVVTFAVWAAILAVFRIFIVRSNLWILPVALILFSPARYMEFLWGFQFTLALSILLPILGLVVLSRIREDDGVGAQLRKAIGALLLIVAGTLCSAGGWFGFIGAIVQLSLQRLPSGGRLLLLDLLGLAMVAVYFVLMRDSGRVPVIDIRNMLFILTALGAAVLGMPDSLTQFGVDSRSIAGAAIILFMVVAIVIAARRRILPSLALACGIFAFALSSVAAIAVAREYLGNWHLAYAAPAIAASYAAAYITFREARSVGCAQNFLAAAMVLMLSPIAWYKGFVEYGPQYNAYIRGIEQYARSYLENPSQAKPFPGTGGWDLDADMVWFLASRGHAVFADEDKAIRTEPQVAVPEAKLSVSGGDGQNRRAYLLVVAGLPASEHADAVIAGGSGIVLRRTDPRLLPPATCTGECFSGWVRAGSLAAKGITPLNAVGLVRRR